MRVRARHNLESRRERKLALGTLGMMFDRTDPAAERNPNHDRHPYGALAAHMQFGQLTDDRIVSRIHETIELHFDHRAITAERHADRGAGNPRLGQRRVDDPSGSEVMREPGRSAETRAEPADVFAHQHNLAIGIHGRAQTVVEGFCNRAHAMLPSCSAPTSMSASLQAVYSACCSRFSTVVST